MRPLLWSFAGTAEVYREGMVDMAATRGLETIAVVDETPS